MYVHLFVCLRSLGWKIIVDNLYNVDQGIREGSPVRSMQGIKADIREFLCTTASCHKLSIDKFQVDELCEGRVFLPEEEHDNESHILHSSKKTRKK